MSETIPTAVVRAKPTRNEELKAAIPTLAGNLAATLNDPAAACFSADDEQFLKFHGIYQQDDRDTRKVGKHYIWMIRGRIPGGVLSAPGYLKYDQLATQYGNQTLRITSRQSFQFHGVVKTGLGPLMRELNLAMMDTLAACGDVNRNVMAPPAPARSELHAEVLTDATRTSLALLPKTDAYHSIWVDGVQLNLESVANKEFADPLYGRTYLPRKFKIAFAVPPTNDTDLFTNDLGYIAIEEHGKLIGYNIAAGGGLGRSHGNEQTYPRLADVIGFVTREQLVDVSKAVLTVHRDFGDRTNRKHARLKYVLEERGVPWFREELTARLGYSLPEARPFQFIRQGDHFGWATATDGKLFLGLYVETGRIKDKPGYELKSALRKIASEVDVQFRLTPSQNVVVAHIDPAHQAAIAGILSACGIPVDNQTTALRRASMACPALPTCGLSLAESERYLPSLMGQIEDVLRETGLADEEIIIRMTGCPNGCARPYMAEIGFVGKAPGRYQLYLGGNEACTRLNRLYKDVVKEADIVPEMRKLLTRFAQSRIGPERFGDWCARVLWNETAPSGN
ncbi:MAG: NADPH-dependent assimilatory sulfite reductase hemoprotein subunit [Pedosphaera sp.]|nr:NADPH-dependent assimilatory sulfite reductase hemoprotein subunit [Pedosphaera sp.]